MFKIGSALLMTLWVIGLHGQPNQKQTEDPKLWRIVHNTCLPNRNEVSPPSPCVLINLARGQQRGYAIIKDKRGMSQFLLIPTVRLEGVENIDTLIAPGTTNYFAEAWKVRWLVSGMREREIHRDGLSLAINSKDNRDQSQFHIHIDCVREEVFQKLAKLKAEESYSWTPVLLKGSNAKERTYLVRRVDGDELVSNPFELVSKIPVAPEEMAHHSIVIVGATNPNGFFILDTFGDGAHGEDLQDHDRCPL